MKRDNKYGSSHTMRKADRYVHTDKTVIHNKVSDKDKKGWSPYREEFCYNHPEYRKPLPRSFIKHQALSDQIDFIK